MTGRQRPATARAAADGMKLHRRLLRLDGRDHTVIGLRPGTAARFSTNRFHETWHVLSDQHGARLLARLLWGLSYQAGPGTLVLIDRPFLMPTPFDADPADPIVLVPGWQTAFGARTARELKRRLPLTRPPDGTVRWRSYGLDAALADPWAWTGARSSPPVPERGGVRGLGGLVALVPASAAEARQWAMRSATLDVTGRRHTDHEFLGPGSCRADGEIQIFRDFRRMVGVARRARADVLARPGTPAGPQALREAVWTQGAAISAERDSASGAGPARRADPPDGTGSRVRAGRGRGRRTRSRRRRPRRSWSR